MEFVNRPESSGIAVLLLWTSALLLRHFPKQVSRGNFGVWHKTCQSLLSHPPESIVNTILIVNVGVSIKAAVNLYRRGDSCSLVLPELEQMKQSLDFNPWLDPH